MKHINAEEEVWDTYVKYNLWRPFSYTVGFKHSENSKQDSANLF